MTYVRDVAFVHDGNSFQTTVARRDGQARRAATGDPQDRQDLDARHCGEGPRGSSKNRRHPAAGTGNDAGERPIGVRARFAVSQWRALAGGSDCKRQSLPPRPLILLFLGSWRSTLVVAISIPLSILTSLLILSLIGETINIMTLGGLALAVGIPCRRRDGGNRKHQPFAARG